MFLNTVFQDNFLSESTVPSTFMLLPCALPSFELHNEVRTLASLHTNSQGYDISIIPHYPNKTYFSQVPFLLDIIDDINRVKELIK